MKGYSKVLSLTKTPWKNTKEKKKKKKLVFHHLFRFWEEGHVENFRAREFSKILRIIQN